MNSCQLSNKRNLPLSLEAGCLQPRFSVADLAAWMVPQLIFWIGILRYAELPGLYMDAVNPDYLVARALNPELHNVVWVLPNAWIPLLGNLYHGVQNFYVGLPVIALLGPSVLSVRIAQALFGAGIIWLLQKIILRLTRDRVIAFLGATALACEIAFLASFRTQFYIILCGQFWLLSAIYMISFPQDEERKALWAFASGVCCSLAIYSYFVFCFFAPAFLIYVWRRHAESPWRIVRVWIAGGVVGLAPYALGYASMAYALGGVSPMTEWLNGALTGLSPMSSKLGFIDGLRNAISNAAMALNNAGNEQMIFGRVEVLTGLSFKVWALVIAGFCLPAVLSFGGRRGRQVSPVSDGDARAMPWLLLLPVSYVLIASLLGTRLWVHHFSILVPLVYLMGALSVSGLIRRIPVGTSGRPMAVHYLIAVLLSGALIGYNFHQQHRFFQKLESVGGAGLTSSALTLLADEAMSQRETGVYLFPDWGFFMSFAVLTGNKVAYELEATPENISHKLDQQKVVHIAFWKERDIAKYAGMFAHDGRVSTVHLRKFYQRDGTVAFYLLSSAPVSEAVSLAETRGATSNESVKTK